MTAYRVTARRTGDWWALEVPAIPGVFSQAKRLDTADKAAREAIALMLDVDEAKVEVTVEPVLPPKAAEAVATAEEARRQAEEAAERAQVAMQTAASVLTESLSQRDAGSILGVSFQRISQLVNLKDAPKASLPDLGLKERKDRKVPAKGRRAGSERDPRAERREQRTRLSA